MAPQKVTACYAGFYNHSHCNKTWYTESNSKRLLIHINSTYGADASVTVHTSTVSAQTTCLHCHKVHHVHQTQCTCRQINMSTQQVLNITYSSLVLIWERRPVAWIGPGVATTVSDDACTWQWVQLLHALSHTQLLILDPLRNRYISSMLQERQLIECLTFTQKWQAEAATIFPLP